MNMGRIKNGSELYLCTYIYINTYVYVHVHNQLPNLYIHTGCPGGNVPDFGRKFLTLKYTDITQNTYVYPKLNGYRDNGERRLKG